MSTLRPVPSPASAPGGSAPAASAARGTGADSLRLEVRLAAVGRALQAGLAAVLDPLPERDAGPQRLAKSLSIDKVLASRLLKALRAQDALVVLHQAPGPEPLRRVLRGARRAGAPKPALVQATAAIDRFEEVIRSDAGDRAALDAILSTWIPEARGAFELRRKQAAHRALSELKGARVETQFSSVLLHPAADGASLDVVWVMGLYGLRRLRPGAVVKLASRRMATSTPPRLPRTLGGEAVDSQAPDALAQLRLDEFCQAEPAAVRVATHGEVVHYVLADEGFGPRSGSDLVLAEVNLAEMPRYVPKDSGRKGYVFAEVAPPTRRLVFDAFVHTDVYPDAEPELALYETAFEGVASVNDRGRDLDRLELEESIVPLGRGLARVRSAHVPRLGALMARVFERMGWDAGDFRGYRVESDYPLYGSQLCLAFDAPAREG